MGPWDTVPQVSLGLELARSPFVDARKATSSLAAGAIRARRAGSAVVTGPARESTRLLCQIDMLDCSATPTLLGPTALLE